MKNLLLEWDDIYSHIKMCKYVFLLCDYDGTVTPIAARPELAVLSPNTKSLLMKLDHLENVTVAIISGRSLDDVKRMVSIPDIIYAGNHGMEISGPHINYTVPLSKKTWELLEDIGKALREQLGDIGGLLIEDKGLTLSVHYRLVEEYNYPVIKNVVEKLTSRQEMPERIKLTHGKKVFEIRPEIDWDKGKAVSLLIELLAKERDLKNLITLYLGDDRTDEDGFQAVNQTNNGISILVNEVPSESAANYFLESPKEVENFLTRLLVTSSEISEKQA